LDLLILKVVALGPVHGYAIAQRLDQVSRGVVQVPQGSLYPAWRRLENRGLLAAAWKATETGRDAKFYHMTWKGRAQLETEAARWRRPARSWRTDGRLLRVVALDQQGSSVAGVDDRIRRVAAEAERFLAETSCGKPCLKCHALPRLKWRAHNPVNSEEWEFLILK
jgi:transcriptional regulator